MRWARVWLLLFLGYTLWGRSFAYLGIPQLKIFVGEVVLASFLIFRARSVFGRWTYWISGANDRMLFGLGWTLLAFVFYGIVEMFLGLSKGHDFTLALQNLVFNVYPLYLFLGLEVGLRYPFLLRRAVRWLALLNGIYGTLYVFILNRLDVSLPWAPGVPLFGQPGGSALALIGLLVFEPRLGRVWWLFLLNLFVLLAVQVRGQWLAFAISLTAWALLCGRMRRVAGMGFLLILFFAGLYLTDLRFPAPEHRGGEFSARVIIARVISPFNPEWAASLIGEKAYGFAGTIIGWRIPWWERIWHAIHTHVDTALLGLGYGYPLWDLYGAIPEGVRTPHNAFFYSLGYTGWLGVFLFFRFLWTLVRTLYISSKTSLEGEFVFITVLGGISGSFFGNVFETPFGAIPFYLLAGFGLAVWVLNYAYPRAPHSLPPTRR